jgi:formylglycine-generating enzyme required for sulfatase activity
VVEATGSAPLVYQWRFNGANLDGATNTLYTIASVQPNNSGQYSVAVGNAYGSVVSSNAGLVVVPFVPLHFEPVTRVEGNYQTCVKATEDQIVAVEISTDLVNWTPFQTNRIGFNGFVVQIITNQQRMFARARSFSNGSTNPPPNTTAPAGMVWIPPGAFTMGSPLTEQDRSSDEGPQTRVTISSGFWMGKYEVTQAQYQSVIGNNPSTFKGDADRPMEAGSWQDATNYCAKITIIERSLGRVPGGYEYRLPTEAEWEYACRAGNHHRHGLWE